MKDPKKVETGRKFAQKRWKDHEVIKNFIIDDIGNGISAGAFTHRGETYIFQNEDRQLLLNRMFEKARTLLEIKK